MKRQISLSIITQFANPQLIIWNYFNKRSFVFENFTFDPFKVPIPLLIRSWNLRRKFLPFLELSLINRTLKIFWGFKLFIWLVESLVLNEEQTFSWTPSEFYFDLDLCFENPVIIFGFLNSIINLLEHDIK